MLAKQILERAGNANSESRRLDFKREFDTSSAECWCELIKDIVAFANSGGGVIVFGVNSDGTGSEVDVSAVYACDTADITNKIAKYTGHQFSEFEIGSVERNGKKCPALIIDRADVPLVFTKPGTYDSGSGKQKTAFSQGTIYFRHGSKSETGNRDDLGKWRDGEIARARRGWLSGIRRVVAAPPDHVTHVGPSPKSLSIGMRVAT